MSENNLPARQQTMAEHELEMQRQIMSVPNATSVPGPPQMPLLPPSVLGSVIPQALNIPPPPMPPQNLPPPRTSQPVIPPVTVAQSGIPQPSSVPPPCAPPASSHPQVPPPAISHSQAPPPPPPCAPPTISRAQVLPPPGAPPPINHSQAPPPCAPPAINHPQTLPPPGAPPAIAHSQAPPPPCAPPPSGHQQTHPPMRAPPPISMPPGPPPPLVMPPNLPPPVMPRQSMPPPKIAPQNLPHPPVPPPTFARPTVPPPNISRPVAPPPNAPNLSVPPPQNIAASLPQPTINQTQTPSKVTIADTSNTSQNVVKPTEKPVKDAIKTPPPSSKILPTRSQPASSPEPQWDEDEIVRDNSTNGEGIDKDLSPDEEDDKLKKPTEVVLPKALEDVLALKDQRAAQMDDDIFTVVEEQLISQTASGVISNEYADADGDSDEDADIPMGDSVLDKQPVQGKLNKNKRKKRRRKQSRKLRLSGQDKSVIQDEEKPTENGDKYEQHDDVAIEYIPERITIADLAPMYRQFYRVFEIFKLENKPKPAEADKVGTANETSSQQKKVDEKTMDDDDDDPEEDKQDDKEKLSKRKLKKLTRLSVAELKQLVSRPDVVEMHDVTARDPKLLVQLKAHRNTVQVPRHWCFKRKYLQGKRGIEKPPFDLPAFIKKTGIMEMRESLQEKDEAKSLKAKMRERTRPKMGKIDIDYQKLHDAFFKWQTKPRMTIHGDLYYEGKEFETRLKEKKPGDLSEELRIALGMPVGPSCHKIPPPWLIAQQRYGPPPSYPNLKIPGLNAPIPDGTSFGYHAGGWGKPPVDENGKPLYGDVFGTNIVDLDNGVDEGDIERNTWGELESESEESSEEEEDEGEDLVNPPDETGLVTPAEGLVTPSGLTSVPAGMETPDNIELRKRKIEAEMEDNETPVLYQVLPEKRTDRVGASMMGSTHVYDVGGVKAATLAVAGATRAPAIGDREGMVELALDPSELDMDSDAMAQRYEQQMREQQSHLQKEDLSDMLAEHVARQKSKRKRQQADTTKQTKKYKEFKF